MSADLNVVGLTARLVRDPELQHTSGGTAVCRMRVAFNNRTKTDAGWGDKGGFIDVVVWGGHGENCAKYLGKGRRVAIEGRLNFDEWDAKDGSGKRSRIEVVAQNVVFLDRGEEDGQQSFQPPADTAGGGETFGVPVGTGGEFPAPDTDDDIPFAWMDRYEVR